MRVRLKSIKAILTRFVDNEDVFLMVLITRMIDVKIYWINYEIITWRQTIFGEMGLLGKQFVMRHLLEKLIEASFSIAIYFITILISNHFNLFEFHDLMTKPVIWGLSFGYGILSSIMIDLIGKWFSHFYLAKQLVLYSLFGCLIFLIMMPNVYGLIAGTVGAFFSLLFLLGIKILKPFKGIAGFHALLSLFASS